VTGERAWNFARSASYILCSTVQQVPWYYNLKFHSSAILLSDRKVLIFFLKKPWSKHRVETADCKRLSCNFTEVNSYIFSSEICKCICKSIIDFVGFIVVFFLPWRNNLGGAKTSSLSRIHDHTQTHHTRQESSVRVISPTQRPLPDNTQH